MKVNNLIQLPSSREEIFLITEQCSQFLLESGGLPILKNLPSTYDNFHKVKVRKRKQRKQDPSQTFVQAFNEAFENQWQNIRERAIFTNGNISFESADASKLDPFYIFPSDGYQYMYSKEVENSSQDYKSAFDAIFEEFGDRGNQVITELLRFSYMSNEKLEEGIKAGAEIIFYNTPYFYAIRTSTVDNYNDMFHNMLNSLEDM